jgi:tetratricopeptide (TPR) repeat protein
MKLLKIHFPPYRTFLVLFLFLPNVSLGQALTVLGGDAWATECFDNAEYVARNMPVISRGLLEPCDSALDYGTLSLADRAATYSNRGIIHTANENIDSAMADFAKATGFRPETAEIYVNRGNAYFLNRDYIMALDDYEYSIELGIRQLHIVRYNIGMTFEKIGNDEEAENQFRVALELEPGWELVEKRLERLLERRAE